MTNLRFATAVHILVLLAHEKADAPGRAACSRHMGASIGANAVVVRRIMGALTEAGLVRTKAGPQGGAWLARPPSKIRISDIYEAVQESPAIGLRKKGNAQCPVGRAAPGVIGGLLAKMDGAAQSALSRISLAQVLKDVEAAAH
jgi:Rrf2 family protein